MTEHKETAMTDEPMTDDGEEDVDELEQLEEDDDDGVDDSA
jgi:hypothetical protein